MIINSRGGYVKHIMADGSVIEDAEEFKRYCKEHPLPDTAISVLRAIMSKPRESDQEQKG